MSLLVAEALVFLAELVQAQVLAQVLVLVLVLAQVHSCAQERAPAWGREREQAQASQWVFQARPSALAPP